MGKVTGFLEFERRGPRTRPVAVRLRDWREVYEPQRDDEVQRQGARCMDCGIPFCTQGCPLGNRIPTFNDLVYRGQWSRAAEQLFATNNFPEFTGRLCPAPCESACVLAIADQAVTIERLEYEVAEHAFASDVAVACPTPAESGYRVAVVGSGPAGLAAAAQLRSVGHSVRVLERSDAIGGLLRYGIPEFKLEKSVLERRLAVMRDAGVQFVTGALVGRNGLPLESLYREYDAVLLAIGSTRPRLIPVPGRELAGIYPAMVYLEAANRAVATGQRSWLDANGAHVVILGGGDTGADCLGTVHRQGAASVTQVEILERPPEVRPPDQPWPTMARLFKSTPAHEEGGERCFSVETLRFVGTDRVTSLEARDVTHDEKFSLPAQVVLIAAGFTGPELDDLALDEASVITAKETVAVDSSWRVRACGDDRPLFACGDAVRGQSLIVWAIAEGRSAAASIDGFLVGRESSLPTPVVPYAPSW